MVTADADNLINCNYDNYSSPDSIIDIKHYVQSTMEKTNVSKPQNSCKKILICAYEN